MIFTVKDKRTGKYKYDTAPECPIHGGPCKLGGCAAFEWFSSYDVEPLEKGYCGIRQGNAEGDHAGSRAAEKNAVLRKNHAKCSCRFGIQKL